MMKSYFVLAGAAAMVLSPAPLSVFAAEAASAVVYETPKEFYSTADFNADGQPDLLIVDKDTGKFRIGYGNASGVYNWVDCRQTGLKGVTGMSIGKVLGKNEGLVVTSPDANQLNLVDLSSPTAPARPVPLAFSAALGPNTVVALDAGGAGNTPIADLYVGSIYNSPDANLLTVLRNDGKDFPKLSEGTLTGAPSKANHLALKAGAPELACAVLNGDAGDTFQADDISTGRAVTYASAGDLPAGSDYTAGGFRKSPLKEFLFYKPGQAALLYRPIEEAGGKLTFGKGASFDLGAPVKKVITVGSSAGDRLVVIFGEGEKAGVFTFDGQKPPLCVQTVFPTNDVFTCAVATPAGFMLFSQPTSGKFATKYYAYKGSGETYSMAAYGSLPSMADNDNVTIPEIHERIVQSLNVKDETSMQAYTNTIPGTRVTYAMVPIKGGEFVMGSPEVEPNRQKDEGPQHKVKIAPFWMGRCEVTWNEYELFMYPDEEKRTRATVPTDAAGDKLADAVTHPSKPYVEMSFGMGKDGFPAISMTQHAANKYCQWLSAKTGHFYRLPTEAEWEYACRAGTTTTYFFGDDESKLGEYGWYEQNSDFKYQKVGKKKPNPWGLYDMCGNVVEWVLDQYDPEFYATCGSSGQITANPWNKATKPYPHAVRGGSWDDEAKRLRSAARRASERAWKMQDPQLPKSIWYFSDAQFVGFRVVRPLVVPPPEELQKYWTSGVERD